MKDFYNKWGRKIPFFDNRGIGVTTPREFIRLIVKIMRPEYKCDQCGEEIAPGEELHYNIGTYCDPCAGAMQ